MDDDPRIDVTFQPKPHEFQAKRSLLLRFQDMAVQMQKMRRAMGYVWLEGGLGAMDDGTFGSMTVHARQSGLILVNVLEPADYLHLERPERDQGDWQRPLATRTAAFHRELASLDGRSAEFVWDEAMFVDRMT